MAGPAGDGLVPPAALRVTHSVLPPLQGGGVADSSKRWPRQPRACPHRREMDRVIGADSSMLAGARMGVPDQGGGRGSASSAAGAHPG